MNYESRMSRQFAKLPAKTPPSTPPVHEREPDGVPPVESPGLGACTPEFTASVELYVEAFQRAQDALQVANEAWDWLRAAGRPTLPASTLARLAEDELCCVVERARRAGVLLHLVPRCAEAQP